MVRVNTVVDNLLAILRDAFLEYKDGGYFSGYDPMSSKPTPWLQEGEVIPEFPLCWDKISVEQEQPDLPDRRGSGRVSVNDDGELEVEPPAEDIITITVLPTAEISTTDYLTKRSTPSTRLEISIIVVTELKEPRWGDRLRHVIFGIIEQELYKNPTLRYPPPPDFPDPDAVVGPPVAEGLSFGNYEFVLESAEDSILQAGSAVQTWNVIPKTNPVIALTPDKPSG